MVGSFKIHCFSLLQRTVLTLLPTSFQHLLLVLNLKVIKGKSCASLCTGAVTFFFTLGFFLGANGLSPNHLLLPNLVFCGVVSLLDDCMTRVYQMDFNTVPLEFTRLMG